MTSKTNGETFMYTKKGSTTSHEAIQSAFNSHQFVTSSKDSQSHFLNDVFAKRIAHVSLENYNYLL